MSAVSPRLAEGHRNLAPGTEVRILGGEPTESEFREAGFTANAINYPMSDAAVAWLCKFNGAPDGWVPPRAWRYAPNAACRDNCEQKAAEQIVGDNG